MSATATLTTDLKRVVLALEDDLRQRVADLTETDTAWRAEHHAAVERGRTASAWSAWRDDRITQVAVSWVLTTVFVRFCEDNALLGPVWISGPGDRHQEALEARDDYFRTNPEHTDREWIEQAVNHLKKVKATAALVDSHAPLHLVSPSGDAATKLLEFWWRRDENSRLLQNFTGENGGGNLDTRFLGDLYQDLSEYARITFALLQTPIFVEEFILDRTLGPALDQCPLDGFRMIDPACGSGHFLLGAFARVLDRWHLEAPTMDSRARVQKALDAVNGVDINPFAVAITQFRLTVEALRACEETTLECAPGFVLHLATGDSLLHGPGQRGFNDITDASSFTYGYEDLPVLQELLQAGRYDVVVGNPPYITVKDKVLNQAYRDRYTSCKGKYALTIPFMERFFGLAKSSADGQTAGWVGQITSNSFMKREFGSKIVEDFLVRKDLRLVADTSGAYIPGHGTPTVILVGRNQRPVDGSLRAVLGVRGEPGRPEVADEGLVWRSIVENVDDPGFDGGWVTIVDAPRSNFTTHPWSLTGGVALKLSDFLDEHHPKMLLGEQVQSIGFAAVTGDDSVFIVEQNKPRSWMADGVPHRFFVEGDRVRDFMVNRPNLGAFPYDAGAKVIPAKQSETFWPFRTGLKAGLAFGRTRASSGKEYWEYILPNWPRLSAKRLIAFAEVSTHNHFVLDRGGKVFKQTAPVIKLLEGASEDDHFALLGVLNSSTACFWLKQKSHNKGRPGAEQGGADESWEHRFQFTSTKLQNFPLPRTFPLTQGRRLDQLAQDLMASAPSTVASACLPTAEVLDKARKNSDAARTAMIAMQEELDWEVYRSYGLIDEDLTYSGIDLPLLTPGERAFSILLARDIENGICDTSWFKHHNHKHLPILEIPLRWPADYRALVQRRIDLIESDPSIRLLEKPENKRRWASESWEKQQTAALRSWLLDRLESRAYWVDRQRRPAPLSIAQLADRVERDADLVSVLALWQGTQGVPVVQSLVALLADEAVPYLAAWRYKDSGLRKRADWESTWALQRREDAGEAVGVIPVPPKYTNADFRKVSYWQARGKLDVPKERFVLYPAVGRSTDPTPLLGWAGWDHAQQALALLTVLGERESEGWDDTALLPLVAGLAELQPWVEQWHSEVDPDMGVSLAGFCATQLSERMTQVGATYESLLAWRPPAATRGRARKVTV